MTADGHTAFDVKMDLAGPRVWPRRRGLVWVGLPVTCLSFVLIGGAGCWPNGSGCDDGCIDAVGVCRQPSHDFCGKAGGQCVDCTAGDQVCDTLRGQCRNIPPKKVDPPPGPCCKVEDGCVPLGQKCAIGVECQMVRGGPGCKKLPPPPPPPPACLRECTDGCCTLDGNCLRGPALVGCEWCDEENGDSGRCESPIERCERKCDGCCTRDGDCRSGRDDQQCGVNGRTCANCTPGGQTCDPKEQRCMVGAVTGGMRICLKSVVIEGTHQQIDTCTVDRARVDIGAALYVATPLASGSERTFSSYAFMQSAATTVAIEFDGACYSARASELGGQLEIEIREQDRDIDADGEGYRLCLAAAAFKEDPALQKKICDDTYRGTDGPGCQKTVDLGGCTLNLLSVLPSSIGGPTEEIPVHDCDGLIGSVAVSVSPTQP